LNRHIRVEILRPSKHRKPALNKGRELRLGLPRVALVWMPIETRLTIASRVGASSNRGG
jgi:hypothetical protein